MLGVSVSVFLSEIGDKTMLATAAYSLSANPFTALVLSTAAYLLANVVPVILACQAAAVFSNFSELVQAFAGVGFAALGVFTLVTNSHEDRGVRGSGSSFLAYFLILTASELGDKTQIASALAAVLTANPIQALVAGALGYLLANCIGITVVQALKNRLSLKMLRKAAAVAFIVLGVFMLVTAKT